MPAFRVTAMRRPAALVALVLCGPMPPGCSDPAFQKKQDRRYGVLAEQEHEFWEREHRRPDQIHWFINTQKAGDARRGDYLREDYYAVRDRFQTDVQTTQRNFQELDEWSKAVLRGRIEKIHPYVVEVWY